MEHRHILIIEDEPSIAETMFDGLTDEGYLPVRAETGEEGLTLLSEADIDLVLLDIRLPGIDGYEVCRQIRQRGLRTPVIMVSARDEVLDRVVGLEVGADDYLIKPFSFRELYSRIKAQLRRAYGELSQPAAVETKDTGRSYTFGAITVDMLAFRARRQGQDLFLTPIEMRLLVLFIEHVGQTLTRDQILDHVWSDSWNPDDPRTVNVHIRHLREKIEADPAKPVYLKTVRGYGYLFDA